MNTTVSRVESTVTTRICGYETLTDGSGQEFLLTSITSHYTHHGDRRVLRVVRVEGHPFTADGRVNPAGHVALALPAGSNALPERVLAIVADHAPIDPETTLNGLTTELRAQAEILDQWATEQADKRSLFARRGRDGRARELEEEARAYRAAADQLRHRAKQLAPEVNR